MNHIDGLVPQRIGLTNALRRAWVWAILTAAYSSLALLKQCPPFQYVPHLPLALDAAAGVAMGVLIALRANRAYERWWEARTLWGTLVNVSRNLAVKVRRMVPSVDQREPARALLVAYCYALKDHLRDESNLQNIPGLAATEDHPSHVPAHLVSKLYALFASWRQADHVGDVDLWMLDREARVLLDVCGACERIKTTLMSASWRILTRQCIAMYLVVMPWGLVDDLGLWTIPISGILGYVALGGEGIATYVEEPFGTSEDHLDLDGICARIEATVNEILATQHP